MNAPSPWQRWGPVIAHASAIPALTCAGGLVGAGLDRLFGTGPILAIVLLVVGFAAAILQLLRGSSPPNDPTVHPPP